MAKKNITYYCLRVPLKPKEKRLVFAAAKAIKVPVAEYARQSMGIKTIRAKRRKKAKA